MKGSLMKSVFPQWWWLTNEKRCQMKLEDNSDQTSALQSLANHIRWSIKAMPVKSVPQQSECVSLAFNLKGILFSGHLSTCGGKKKKSKQWRGENVWTVTFSWGCYCFRWANIVCAMFYCVSIEVPVCRRTVVLSVVFGGHLEFTLL